MGNGFENVFKPGADFDWTLRFYDVVTLFDINQYTLTSTTKLINETLQVDCISLSVENDPVKVSASSLVLLFATVFVVLLTSKRQTVRHYYIKTLVI